MKKQNRLTLTASAASFCLLLSSCSVISSALSSGHWGDTFNAKEEMINFVKTICDGDKKATISMFSLFGKERCPRFEEKVDDVIDYVKGSLLGLWDGIVLQGSSGRHENLKRSETHHMYAVFKTDLDYTYQIWAEWTSYNSFCREGEGIDYAFVRLYSEESPKVWPDCEYGLFVGEQGEPPVSSDVAEETVYEGV